MSKYCIGIIGTDTDAGKTIVTASLAYKLRHKNPLLIKAIQTGCSIAKKKKSQLIAPDIEVYKDAVKDVATHICYKFQTACSPHLAFQNAKKLLSARNLAGELIHKVRSSDCEITIIEGAGGFMTPINNEETFADVFSKMSVRLNKKLNRRKQSKKSNEKSNEKYCEKPFKKPCFSLILVINNKLGALNHALLTYAKVRALGIPLSGFVMTETSTPKTSERTPSAITSGTKEKNSSLEKQIQESNIEFLKQYLDCEYLGSLPYHKKLESSDYQHRQKAYKELSKKINLSSLGFVG